jgi:cytochrome c oxidase subunit II
MRVVLRRRIVLPGLLLTAFIGTATPAPAAEPTLAARLDDYAYCTVCHGATGGGNLAIRAPALGGIEPWYLEAQLKAYRARQRGADDGADPAGAEMRIVAGEIDDARLPSIARYVAGLDGRADPPATPPTRTTLARGRAAYGTHCASCHGPRGAGDAALGAPGLARLNDWYVVAAWQKYRSGLRGTATAAGAPTALAMQASAAALPGDFPIEDVAAWLTTQAPRAATIGRGPGDTTALRSAPSADRRP